MSQPLDQQVAIVTGAAPIPSIGYTAAEILAQRGANVLMVDVNPAVAGSAERLETGAGEVHPHVADLTDEAAVCEMFERVDDDFGRLDILVNLAAIQPPFVPLAEMSLADWRRVAGATLDSSFLTCRAAVPRMRRAGYGRIVNTSSGTTHLGLAGLGAYVTAKAGVIGFTRVLAREVGGDGITANVIMPGLTETKHTMTMLPEDEGAEHFDEHVNLQCIKRRGLPGDVANAIGFLVSPEAAFVTGQTLNVTGGLAFN